MTKAEKELKEFNKKQEKLDDKIKKLEQATDYKNKKSKLLFPTFTKNLVALIILVCLIDLQLTYILAFFDKANVAETLSTSLCTTILGVAFVYMIRAYFDSKAEHSNLDDAKKLSNELGKALATKIGGVINDAIPGAGDDVKESMDSELPPMEDGEYDNIENIGSDN